MHNTLENKAALVTGGAVRLGRAIALALAREGAGIAITYNSSKGQAEKTCQEIQAIGQTCLAIQADFSTGVDMNALIQQVVDTFGHIDILINSAAIFEPGYWNDTDAQNWDRHFDINLKAPFFLSQAFAKALQPDQRGHIVNITDWRGERPAKDHFAYTLTKAGLLAMTKSLALSLAPNIQVNAVSPGLILPPPGKDESYLWAKAPDIPLKHPGSAKAISDAVLYLVQSDFVTGEILQVTGGEHL